MPKIFSCNLFI